MADIIYNFLLLLDGVIYNLVDWLYDIFDFLARVNIFSNDTYSDIVQRIYLILGLFMLFVLAYSLLKATINPDEFAKGENSFPSLIKNVVISLVIIVLLPMIFTVAFNIQNVVLNNDTIPSLILGTDEFDRIENSDAGHRMAYYTFRAFFHENEDWCESEENNYSISDGTCAQNIRGNGGWFDRNGEPLSDVRAGIENGESFSNYSNFGEAVTAGEIQYMFLLSTAAGIFLIYVLLNFCFDLAVRVVKLAFYQIIAPIPVVCRILPGGNMKDVFSKWVKQVISVFLEVFIRIGIMNLGVFLITEIIDNFDGISGLNSLDFTQQCIVMALLIMGVVIFIRQAPKLLGDLLHLDTGGMKLGLMDKLAMGGGLLAGAAVGGIATAGARNLVAGGRNVWQRGKQTVQNVRSARGGRDKAKALLGGAASVAGSVIGGAASTVAGAASGGVRAGRGGIKAKNFRDVTGAVSRGADEAYNAKLHRESYKSSHRINKIPVVGGVVGSALGHASDTVMSARDWLTGGVGQFEERIKLGKDFKSAGDAIFDEAGKILAKNSNNPDVVANMTSFKGDTNGELLNLYNSYSGMSMSAIEADINRQSNIVDFSSFVDRDSYYSEKIDITTGKKTRVFDAQGYQNAIDAEAKKHAMKMANLRNMYSQLEKETKLHIVNTALDSNMSINGIDDSKLQGIRDKFQAFNQQYVRYGASVHDPASDKDYGSIDVTRDPAHDIDNITTAFANIGSEASANAAKYRQAMENRKGNK